MGSRRDERDAARERRLEQERAEAGADARRRRVQTIVGAGLFALIVVAVLIVVSQSGSDDGGSGGSVESLFADLPQDGIALGDPDAPVTMVEFADLQCPICAQYSNEALPDVIDRYVRPGDIRLELRFVAVIDSDSITAARVAYAASLQDQMWQFADAFYRDQGQEGSGYVNDDFMRGVAKQAPDLDIERALADANGPEVDRLLMETDGLARRFQVTATPTFVAGKTGGQLKQLDISALDIDAFSSQLEPLIKGG